MKVRNESMQTKKSIWHEIIKLKAELNKMKTSLTIQRNNETELDL